MKRPGAIVIDTETTGFSTWDRIAEIAVITLAPDSWETVDEYDTLINPQRDTGPIHVHGITPTMVELAPLFSDVIADLARRMKGQVLICHNASYDSRMLGYEFERLAVEIRQGSPLCTFRATRQKLGHACEDRGIDLEHGHRALADARATAELARSIWGRSEAPPSEAVWVGDVRHPPSQHTLRREMSDAETTPMRRIVSRAHYPHADEAISCYLDCLDWILDDAVIDHHEEKEMRRLAEDLGISPKRQHEAHEAYLRCIIDAAQRDGIVTEAERGLIAQIADQLEVGHDDIPEITFRESRARLKTGMRVCFTGQVVIDGEQFDRETLQAMARENGMVPVSGVTIKGCDLLVAADPSSLSGKAKHARKHGIPIMSAQEFVSHCD